jgi:hypothetical protein
MWYVLLADGVAIVHFLFVVFVVAGSLLVLRWPRAIWFHGPALVWGLIVECRGIMCPLTSLENRLRLLGGGSAYTEDFITHCLLPLLYPPSLTRGLQITLGASLLLLNLWLYAWMWAKRRPRTGSSAARAGRSLNDDAQPRKTGNSACGLLNR